MVWFGSTRNLKKTMRFWDSIGTYHIINFVSKQLKVSHRQTVRIIKFYCFRKNNKKMCNNKADDPQEMSVSHVIHVSRTV